MSDQRRSGRDVDLAIGGGGDRRRRRAARSVPRRWLVAGFATVLYAAAAAGAASAPSDASLALVPGQALTASAGPDETHRYSLVLSASTATAVTVTQVEGLVDVYVDGPGPDPLMLRTEAGRNATIDVPLVSAVATHWNFSIRPRKAGARYHLAVQPVHVATTQDESRYAGLRQYALAEALRRENFRETATMDRLPGVDARAREAYEFAGRDFQAAGDNCGAARALIGDARMEVALGNYAAARAASEAALVTSCMDAIADRAQAYKTLGMAAAYQGDFSASADAAEEALALYEQTGDQRYQGIVLGNLSAVYMQQGATSRALGAASRALRVAEANADRQGVVFSQKSIAAIHLARGELAPALRDYRLTLQYLAQTPYPMIEGETWNDLGILYHRLADYDSAGSAYAQAQRIWRRMNNRTGAADTMLNQAEALLDAGRVAGAARDFRQGLALAEADGLMSVELRAWRGLGACDARRGDWTAARARIERSLQIATATGELAAQSSALRALGDVDAGTGRPSEALENYHRALDLARQAADLDGEAATLERRARTLANSGQLDAGRADIEQALTLIESQRGQISEDRKSVV